MTEKKTISLTIGERLAALKVFDAFKGSLSTLAVLVDDVKQFPITTEEWEKAGLTKTPSDAEVAALPVEEKATATQQWKWNDEESEKDIILNDDSALYLKSEIKRKSDSGEITLADVALVNLNKKL